MASAKDPPHRSPLQARRNRHRAALFVAIHLGALLVTPVPPATAFAGCDANDESCMRTRIQACESLPDICEDDPNQSCVYGAKDMGSWCSPPDVCRDNLVEELGDCPPAPPCPLGEYHRGCSYTRGWSSNPCRTEAPLRQAGTNQLSCSTQAPPTPSCTDVDGAMVNGSCQTTPAARVYEPATRLYAQDTCSEDDLRLLATWRSRVHDEPTWQNRSWHVYVDTGDGLTHWATLNITHQSIGLLGPFVHGQRVQVRIQYDGPEGPAWGLIQSLTVQACRAATHLTATLTSSPAACVQAVQVEFRLDEQEPLGVLNFQFAEIHRHRVHPETGERLSSGVNVERVHLNHDMLHEQGPDADGTTRYAYLDHYLTPGYAYEYHVVADYGTRGRLGDDELLSPGVATEVVPRCQAPEIVRVEPHEPVPHEHEPVPARPQRIDVTWTWTPWEQDLDHWLYYVVLVRSERYPVADPAVGVAAYDEDGHNRLIGGRVVAYLKPPVDGESTYRDYTVKAGVQYEYQLQVRPFPWSMPSLHSNTAQAWAPGLPWAPEELRVESVPYVHRNESRPQPPGGYPLDLPERPDEYGVALVSWQPGPNGASPVTQHQVIWQTPGRLPVTCTYTPDELNAVLPLVYPDDFRDEERCTRTEEVQDVFAPGDQADVTAYSFNEFGRSLGAHADNVEAWSFPNPRGVVEDRTTDPAHDGNPEPTSPRESVVARTDEIRHHVTTVTTQERLVGGFRPMDPRAYEGPPRDVEPSIQLGLPGAICQSDGVLEIRSERLWDDRVLGYHADEPFRFQPLRVEDVNLTLRAQSFDTHPPARAVDPTLPIRRVHDHWHTTEHRDELRNATWSTLSLPEAEDGLDGSWRDWNEFWPIINTSTTPRLPFNAVGSYCWLDGLYVTATAPPSTSEPRTPHSATQLDLGDTQYLFRHTAHDEGTRATTAYNYGLRGGNTCYCTYQTQHRVDEVHVLRQEYRTAYNRYAQLTNAGWTLPLAGSDSVLWTEEDSIEYADTVFARYERLIDEGFTPAFLHDAAEFQREELPFLYRWDQRDAISTATKEGQESRTVTAAWIDVRPDWGAKDARSQWYVPGNFAPVAYLGGLHEEAHEPGSTWRFRYSWSVSADGGASWTQWIEDVAVPWMNRALPYTTAFYDDSGGTVSWRVVVNATLTSRDGDTLDSLELLAEEIFRLDRLTLRDVEPLDLGVPLLKEDQDPGGFSLYRGAWYTWPWAAAPWDQPPGEGEWWRDSYSSEHPEYWSGDESSLPPGASLRIVLDNDVELITPDPTTDIGSEEPPRLGREATEDEAAAFRAEDSFVRFTYQSSPDAKRSGDTRLAVQAFTIEDLHGPLGYYGSVQPGLLDPDGTRYEVQDGDRLSFLLYVSPVRTAGELTTPYPAWDGTSQTLHRTRVNVVPEYEDGAPATWTTSHPWAVNQWNRIHVPLDEDRNLVGIRIHAQPYVGDAPPDAAYHVFYLDDLVLENPQQDRVHHLLNAHSTTDPTMELLPGDSRGLERAWVESVVQTGIQLSEEWDEDPSNPFLLLHGAPHPFGPDETEGRHRQPLWSNGLVVGVPATTTDAELDTLRYEVPDGTDQFQVNPFLRGFLGESAGGATGFGTFQPHAVNYKQVWTTDAWLRFDDPDSRTMAPRAEPGGEPGPSQNLQGLAQVWPAYSHTTLSEDPRAPDAVVDYLRYDARQDHRRILLPDGQQGHQTAVPGVMLQGHATIAAAPVGPFMPTKPVLITGDEDALVIDLNDRSSWELLEIQDRIHDDFDPNRHAWVHVRPYATTLLGCYRLDPEDAWRPIEDLVADPRVEANEVLLRFWRVIYQDTPENRERATLGEYEEGDPDYCTSEPDVSPAQITVDGESLHIESQGGVELAYLAPDPNDAGGRRAEHVGLGRRSAGHYEATVPVVDGEVVFLAVHDDHQFFTRSARLAVGDFDGDAEEVQDGRVMWVVLSFIGSIGAVLGAAALIRWWFRRTIAAGA